MTKNFTIKNIPVYISIAGIKAVDGVTTSKAILNYSLRVKFSKHGVSAFNLIFKKLTFHYTITQKRKTTYHLFNSSRYKIVADTHLSDEDVKVPKNKLLVLTNPVLTTTTLIQLKLEPQHILVNLGPTKKSISICF